MLGTVCSAVRRRLACDRIQAKKTLTLGSSSNKIFGLDSSSSAVNQLCLDPQSTCCQELGGETGLLLLRSISCA